MMSTTPDKMRNPPSLAKRKIDPRAVLFEPCVYYRSLGGGVG